MDPTVTSGPTASTVAVCAPSAPTDRPRHGNERARLPAVVMTARDLYTADLHVGHGNIIKYCNRPFRTPAGEPDVDAMNDAIIDTFTAQVNPQDRVWVFGDVFLGGVEAHLELVAYLPGHLILVPGNHDPCWAGKRKGSERWTERFLEAGFAEVRQGPTRVPVADQVVNACHFPYQGDSHEEDRFTSHRPIDRGGWLLHGHVHDAWRQRGRQINVGIDAWGGRLVTTDDLVELMDGGPADLDPIPWH